MCCQTLQLSLQLLIAVVTVLLGDVVGDVALLILSSTTARHHTRKILLTFTAYLLKTRERFGQIFFAQVTRKKIIN